MLCMQYLKKGDLLETSQSGIYKQKKVFFFVSKIGKIYPMPNTQVGLRLIISYYKASHN